MKITPRRGRARCGRTTGPPESPARTIFEGVFMPSFPRIGQQILNFIDGAWQESCSARWTDRYDPAKQSVLVAHSPDSSREDAIRAINAAARAASAWRDWPAPKRGRLLF